MEPADVKAVLQLATKNGFIPSTAALVVAAMTHFAHTDTYFHFDPTEVYLTASSNPRTLVSYPVPEGRWIVFASTQLVDTSGSKSGSPLANVVHCAIKNNSSDVAWGSVGGGPTGHFNIEHIISAQTVIQLSSPAVISFECSQELNRDSGDTRLSKSSLLVMSAGREPAVLSNPSGMDTR